MNTDLDFITIAQASALIERRALSPVELLDAKLSRIKAMDGQINAFITLTEARARADAKRAEQEISAGARKGSMHGIPFALKDIYDTAGILTSGHSRVSMHDIPREDAAVTSRLTQAGGVLIGKLATNEFAHGSASFDAPWPPARNPWNPAYFTGGSSTGSGAAVAAGFVPAAMGTDTGGSVRNPAACCGVVGLKPTFGLISRYGVIPNSFTFDHCGPLTWTVEDCAIVLGAIAGHDPRDPGSVRCDVPDYRGALNRRDLQGLRIGVIRQFWEEDLKVSDEVSAAMERALAVLKALGAQLEVVRMRPLQEYTDVKMTIAETELFAIHQKDLIERPGDFGAQFLAGTLAGCLFSAVDYVQAQRQRREILMEMDDLYARYDVLVTVSSGPATRFDRISTLRSWMTPNIHTAFSVTGGPSLVVCNGFSSEGLPLAMQIVGRPFDDAKVLGVGHAYETAAQWRSRRPQLEPGAQPVPVTPPPVLTGSSVDAATRLFVDQQLIQAGVELPDTLRALLYEAAPYARAMAARIQRKRPRPNAPGNVFVLPSCEISHGAS
jgi:aspartyl-tRNA(Asn)/glutamyl-tRNA(Gln) amidotransferase subunit A